MTRRRLPFVALGVAVLVAVVALVAHGRPLGASAGKSGGLPWSFWNYTFTTLVIAFALVWLGMFLVLLQDRPAFNPKKTSHLGRTLRQIAALLVVGLAMAYAVHQGAFHHPRDHRRPAGAGSGNTLGDRGGRDRPGTQVLSFKSDEIAVVVGLVLVAGAILVLTRGRGKPRPLPSLAPEAVAAALDDSLDDLRADPDLRRAIIAAYARMERALAAAGLPRLPSEAPLEYLERALLELHASGPAVRQLTDLFEWARFSDHEPDRTMRDDAVDALEAIRDELRAPALVPA